MFSIMPKNDIGSLVKASRKGDLERIKQLLDWGINVNASNKRVEYPLNEALVSKDLETIKLLLDAGADPSNVLEYALREGNKERLEFLLTAGIDANLNMNGLTLLTAAVWYDNLEATELLLDYGADINAESSGRIDGNALSIAMLEPENFDIVRLLLKRGADVNAEGAYGSMLQTAIYRHQVEMVKILLSDERIDVNAEAGERSNAWEVAYDEDNSVIIEILRKHKTKSTKTLLRRRILEDSSDETISDEKSLRKNTEVENQDKDTWRENTMKQEEQARVLEENSQKEEIQREKLDRTRIWLDEVRTLLSGYTNDTFQSSSREIVKIPVMNKEIKEILKLLCQIFDIVIKML